MQNIHLMLDIDLFLYNVPLSPVTVDCVSEWWVKNVFFWPDTKGKARLYSL